MKKRQGFTLVELLVVIAILAVLASVSVVGYLGFTAKANLSADKEEASQASRALQYYLVDHEDVDLENSEDVRNAVLAATDGKYDLKTLELRSANRGYHLLFNTDTKQIEVVKEVPVNFEAVKEVSVNSSTVRGANKVEMYSTIDAFLWTEATPYLFVEQKGNDFTDLIVGLNNGTITVETASEKLAKDYGEDNVYLDMLKSSMLFVASKDEITKGVALKDDDKTYNNILYSSNINSISGEIDGTKIPDQIVLPKNISKVEAGTFFNASNKTFNIKNDDFTFGMDAFGDNTTLNYEKKFRSLELIDHVTYSSNKVTINYNEEEYELEHNKLINTNTSIEEEVKIDENDLKNIESWCNSVDVLKTIVIDYNYRLFDALENGKTIVSEIFSTKAQYDSLLIWEKELIQSAYKAEYLEKYEVFYAETDNVLNANTGIYTRYDIYIQKIEESKKLLKEKVSENAFESTNRFDLSKLLLDNKILENDTSANGVSYNDLFNAVSLEGKSVTNSNNILYRTPLGGISTLNIVPKDGSDEVSIVLDFTGDGYESFDVLTSGVLDENNKFNITVGNENQFVIGIVTEGKLNSNDDIKNYFRFNDGFILEKVEKISLENSDCYLLYLKNNSVGKTDLNIFLSGLESSNSVSVNVLDGYTNVLPTNGDVKFEKGNVNQVLTYNILYSRTEKSGFIVEDIVGKGNQLTYVINKTSTPAINFEGGNFDANNYRIDISKLDFEHTSDDMRFISASNGVKISNLHVKLDIPRTYEFTNTFNKSATCIYITNYATLDKVVIDGGVRGLRILPSNDEAKKTIVTNSYFTNNAVSIEIYMGESSTKNIIDLTNITINPTINNSKDETDTLIHGIPLLYFPGNGGSGINNFDKVSLSLKNVKSYGWLTKEDIKRTVNVLLDGVLSIITSQKIINGLQAYKKYIVKGDAGIKEAAEAVDSAIKNLKAQIKANYVEEILKNAPSKVINDENYYNLLLLLPNKIKLSASALNVFKVKEVGGECKNVNISLDLAKNVNITSNLVDINNKYTIAKKEYLVEEFAMCEAGLHIFGDKWFPKVTMSGNIYATMGVYFQNDSHDGTFENMNNIPTMDDYLERM